MAHCQPIFYRYRRCLVLCLFLLIFTACCKPPIKIHLISDGTIYEPDAPIQVQVRVVNVNTDIFGRKQAVVTRRGFFDQNFHLRLSVIDPDGLPVAKSRPESVVEPGPPYRSGDSFIVPVEFISPEAENIYLMKDLRDYYRIRGTAGWYTAQVRASLETFGRYDEAPSGELSAALFAKGNRSYNPLVSNKIRFEILPKQKEVRATVRTLVYAATANGDRPSTESNDPLESAQVRLYRVSQLPKNYRSPDRQSIRELWNQIRPQASVLTNARGEAVFSGIAQDDYLVLARHPAFEKAVILGERINEADERWQDGKVVEVQLNAGR